MRLIIYPHDMQSESAKRIQSKFKQQGYDCLRVRKNGAYAHRPNDVILNWGTSKRPDWYNTAAETWMLNRPENVDNATNKYRALDLLHHNNVPAPEFTRQRNVAQLWLDSGTPVVRREILRGGAGQGVNIVDPGEALEPARLFTKYMKKRREFRVHVFLGKVICVQEKLRKHGAEIAEPRIRSDEAHGWAFCRTQQGDYDESIPAYAVKAVAALNLDFGGVDVIWNDYYQQAMVLEVNSAPGIDGQDLDNYVEAIKHFMLTHE